MRGRDNLRGIVELSRARVDFRALGSDRVGQNHLDELLLALEVVVERPEADVGLVRDLLDARVVYTLAGEQGFGGLDQLRSCRLASACVSIRDCGHGWHRFVDVGDSGTAKALATAR